MNNDEKREQFEMWLRTVCFQKPTPEAHDLAWEAWQAAQQSAQPNCRPLPSVTVSRLGVRHLRRGRTARRFWSNARINALPLRQPSQNDFERKDDPFTVAAGKRAFLLLDFYSVACYTVIVTCCELFFFASKIPPLTQ